MHSHIDRVRTAVSRLWTIYKSIDSGVAMAAGAAAGVVMLINYMRNRQVACSACAVDNDDDDNDDDDGRPCIGSMHRLQNINIYLDIRPPINQPAYQSAL